MHGGATPSRVARNAGDFPPAGEAHERIQALGAVEEDAPLSRGQVNVLEGPSP